MYKVGDWFGQRILERGRIKFLPRDAVMKVETWFARYGYWIIIGNRFLAGTRAVVSFFAGISHLNLRRVTILSGASALAWNAILVVGGFYLGKHWQRIGFFLNAYSQIVTGILIALVLYFVIRYLSRRYSKKAST